MQISGLTVIDFALLRAAATTVLPDRAAKLRPDEVEGLLAEMATPAIASLLAEIEKGPLAVEPGMPAHVVGSMRNNIRQGHSPRAVTEAIELCRALPGLDEAVRAEAGFEEVEAEWKMAVRVATAEAHSRAETRLAAATLALEQAGAAGHPGGADLATVLALAVRFLEAGRLSYLVRSEVLSEHVIAKLRIPRGALAESVHGWFERSGSTAVKLWRRAPLLVLLLLWLLVGIAGWIPVELFAHGMLGLVGFGFLARVKQIRF